MQHGTQPSAKPSKPKSDDRKERKRGVQNVLPPRDGTTRTEGVSQKHRQEDRVERMQEDRQEHLSES